ncbi:MAG: Crp/Fnr family transcriptional regulator, partial [Thermoleophilia bacterium]|nr:Crp/Fnr family transcriptional regulator [Thermoleophilia bacterium]
RTGLAAGCAAAVDRAAELLARCDCTARTVGLARRELSAVRDCMQGIGNASLVAVSEDWSRRGRPLDAARVLVAAAAAMRPGGDREQLARRAQTLLAGTGADAIQQQVTRLLRADRDEAARCALADAALFAGVDAAVREELLRHAVEVRRPAGSVLHEPDDALDALWIVRSGSVRLCRVTDDERRLTVELLDPGALLGEHALLGLPRAGTLAECEESVVLSVLPVARVSAASRRCPRLAENLLTLAGARMERSRQLAERVAFWTVDRRIARCLLDLELQYGRDTLDGHRIIERTFTHFQIAELVNARRETVGDFLKRMRGAGVLELRRRRIVLLDPAALQAIVDER